MLTLGSQFAREVWDRVLKERQIRQDGEMQMYICCLMPRFWPLQWLWKRRMAQWWQLVQEEEVRNVHLVFTDACRKEFYERMLLHDDGRSYAMVIRNNGEILWGSHDGFKENLQQKEMVRVVNEECQWRMDQHEKLLEASSKGAIEASKSETCAGKVPTDEITKTAAPSLEAQALTKASKSEACAGEVPTDEIAKTAAPSLEAQALTKDSS